jgi:putative FmdB family regulatory protein
MPIYEYSALEPCLLQPTPCSGALEILGKMSDPDLSICPTCGARIARVLSATAGHLGQKHLLAEKNVAAKGFTQYRRAGGGVYEKTAGSGPQFISDDGG